MSTLSELDSKALLAEHGLRLAPEQSATSVDQAVLAADAIGYPCVMKLSGDHIAHKTERNLVRLALGTRAQAESAAQELFAAVRPDDGETRLLVAPMISSNREFIVGAQRSPAFGPVVMLGIGGIFAEVLDDVVFRLLPATDVDLGSMLDDLANPDMLRSFRGEPAVDRNALVAVIRAIGDALLARDDVDAIDVNPVLIDQGQPVAVDALVVLADAP